MHCHICGAEAVGRCYTCGALFCVRHGTNDCQRCETAIAPGDRRADRVSEKPLAPKVSFGWWRPIPAEDFAPPGCYVCSGLTRQRCRNCRELYCRDHGGYAGLCRQCTTSARIGLYVFLGAVAVIMLLMILTVMR
jgi:hypothetical protein